ncbi:rod shape-determining protein MreC [Poritiphilus flavus]|uniref:Cell shape-determining protein MreC n=1 Tax=Poritiphilus flavus TaxID=2697053 RepID=A0A6L9EE33_9FLAO|nr:rod shape-determining protein MreC [Poritiphilus flavus]NAS12828.1 rod shape-determining protein MreC [Poritiphilus flavus]
MQQIANFIIRYKTSLLYMLLLFIALAFTVQSHSYHRSKFFNSANWFSGTVYSASSSISSYFDLDDENRALVEENTQLKRLLLNSPVLDSVELDTTEINYTILPAQIIKNSYANPDNYITINRGKRDSVKQDMGVITAKGILGIVEITSNRFAAVQSILNTKSTINAKIKNTNYFGSLTWDTKRYDVVQLEDIPRLVPLLVGDTIVTGAMSSIFPENIPIGTIKKFDLNASKSFYRIDVELFNDMTNLKNVYVIENINRPEVLQLESEINNQ